MNPKIAPAPKNFAEALTRAGQRIADERRAAQKDAATAPAGPAGAHANGTAQGLDRALKILEEEYNQA